MDRTAKRDFVEGQMRLDQLATLKNESHEGARRNGWAGCGAKTTRPPQAGRNFATLRRRNAPETVIRALVGNIGGGGVMGMIVQVVVGLVVKKMHG